jgi:CBS domain-containing protein
MGYAEVYDYVAGKLDWLASGLPFEGDAADRPRAGSVARDDVPTCRLDEKISEVKAKVQEAGWDSCVVVNQERIVLGQLKKAELESDDGALAEEVMRPGPSTFRPHVPIEELASYLSEEELDSTLVTTSEGRLMGLLLRDDALRAAHEHHSHHHSHG